jgi:hypothetical protein
MTPRKPTYVLAGIRTPAEVGSTACSACTGVGAPALVLMERKGNNDLSIIHRLCLPCIGRACEQATGWKIMRAWSQWLASSIQSQTLRAGGGTNTPED